MALAREEAGDSGPRATVYVSPNDREEPSDLGQAKAHFGDGKHRTLGDLAKRVGENARHAIGVWADGAEESTVFEAPAKKAVKAAALAGLKAKQKAVAVFQPKAGGSGVRYRISYPPTPFDRAVSLVMDSGIPFQTAFPADNDPSPGVASETHVLGDKEMAPKVAAAAEKLGGRVEAEEGDLTFIGHDSDRDLARREYLRLLRG